MQGLCVLSVSNIHLLDINCQVDLVKAHMTRLRALHPNNPVVLVCEANSKCRYL